MALKQSTHTWNLGWLSYAPEHGSKFNAHFTVAVAQTCGSLLANGAYDILEREPIKLKVAGVLHLPPPAAFKRITEAPGLLHLPLYKLFGADWLRVMSLRAQEYREPFDPVFDSPVPTLTLSEAVIATL